MKYTIGTDSQYFLANDTNDVLRQTQGLTYLDESVIQRIYRCHSERRDLTNSMNAEYFHIIAPNKETALSNFLPPEVVYEAYGKTPVRQYLSSVQKSAELSFFHPEVFRESSTPNLYYRTDTHWSPAGALSYLRTFFADRFLQEEYEALCKLDFRFSQRKFVGDLGKHAGLEPELIDDLELLEKKSDIVFAGNIVNEGYVRHTMNSSAHVSKKVLFLHDSFAHNMFNFLSEIFSEVFFVHCPDLDTRFAKEFSPQIIFYMQAERFFPRVPLNNVDLAAWLSERAIQKGVNSMTPDYVRGGWCAG